MVWHMRLTPMKNGGDGAPPSRTTFGRPRMNPEWRRVVGALSINYEAIAGHA